MKKFAITAALLAGLSLSACSGEQSSVSESPKTDTSAAPATSAAPEAEAPQVVKYECSNVTGTLTLRADGMWWARDNGEDTIALPLGTTVDEAIAALPGCVVA